MTKSVRLWMLVAVAVALVATTEANAGLFGRRNKGNCGSSCNTGCNTGCNTYGHASAGCNTCDTCGQQGLATRRMGRSVSVASNNACCNTVVLAGGPVAMTGSVIPTAASPLPADRPMTATPPIAVAPMGVAPYASAPCSTCDHAVVSTGCDDCGRSAPARRRGLFRR